MTRGFLLATVAGAVTLFVMGGVLYGLLEDFFANEVSRAMPVWWALGLGMALMGYATMEDVQTLATVGGHTLIGVVTNGTAGAVIAKVLNRGGD